VPPYRLVLSYLKDANTSCYIDRNTGSSNDDATNMFVKGAGLVLVRRLPHRCVIKSVMADTGILVQQTLVLRD